MPGRPYALFLLAGICWAAGAEPKPRPRLPAPVVTEVKRENGRPDLERGTPSRFRSFEDFLQAEGRQPTGLETYREPPAAPAKAAGGEKSGLASGNSSSEPSRTEVGGADVLVLPKLEITAERLTKLEKQLAALEANQSWEASSAEAWDKRTVVDAILNPPFLRLGSYSGRGRAAVARQRVELLRWVRILEISLEEARTPAEKARLQADIDGIRSIMKHWE